MEPSAWCSLDSDSEGQVGRRNSASGKKLNQRSLFVEGLGEPYSRVDGERGHNNVHGVRAQSRWSYTTFRDHCTSSEPEECTEGHGEGEEAERKGDGSFEAHVYNELSAIRDKLKEQTQWLSEEEQGLWQHQNQLEEKEVSLKRREKALKKREARLQEMEKLACEAHTGIMQCIEQEAARRLRENQEMEEKIARLSSALQEKDRENQRLRNSFETIKQANEGLRQQLEAVTDVNAQLQAQVTSTQRRLTNLQRRNEYTVAKQQQQSLVAEEQAKLGKVVPTGKAGKERGRQNISKVPIGQSYYEVLGTALGWLSQAHLSRTYPSHSPQHEPDATNDRTQQYCGKVLPQVADLLPQVAGLSTQLQLSFLEFLYWSFMHLTAKRQRSTLTSTLRRIGEEVYKPSNTVDQHRSTGSISKPPTAPKAFFRSADLHVRLLSSLVVMGTLTQVDCVAHAFDALRQDVKEDFGKGVFLAYQGVDVVLPFMRASNRALCGHAVDIFLQLTVDSALLPNFLAACSNEGWLGASTALLRESHTVDLKVLEKLSIILQRLSKIRSNHRLFEVFQLCPVVQEILRSHSGLPDSSFLTLNLQSILINLTSK